MCISSNTAAFTSRLPPALPRASWNCTYFAMSAAEALIDPAAATLSRFSHGTACGTPFFRRSCGVATSPSFGSFAVLVPAVVMLSGLKMRSAITSSHGLPAAFATACPATMNMRLL